MTQEAPAMIKSALPGRRMNLEEWTYIAREYSRTLI